MHTPRDSLNWEQDAGPPETLDGLLLPLHILSVLVHKSLQFTLLDLHLDPEARYVVLHATCDRLEVLIVGLYIPPQPQWHYYTK